MKSLNPLANEIGRLPTHAVEARTHGFGVAVRGVGQRNTAPEPTESVVRDPLSLAAGRSNPNNRAATVVDDCQGPFRFKVQNISVRNPFSSERIDDNDHFVAENKFRSDPQHVHETAKNRAECPLSCDLQPVVSDDETVCREESDENHRRTGPRKIALGSKSFMHVPSIAGVVR